MSVSFDYRGLERSNIPLCAAVRSCLHNERVQAWGQIRNID